MKSWSNVRGQCPWFKVRLLSRDISSVSQNGTSGYGGLTSRSHTGPGGNVDPLRRGQVGLRRPEVRVSVAGVVTRVHDRRQVIERLMRRAVVRRVPARGQLDARRGRVVIPGIIHVRNVTVIVLRLL